MPAAIVDRQRAEYLAECLMPDPSVVSDDEDALLAAEDAVAFALASDPAALDERDEMPRDPHGRSGAVPRPSVVAALVERIEWSRREET